MFSKGLGRHLINRLFHSSKPYQLSAVAEEGMSTSHEESTAASRQDHRQQKDTHMAVAMDPKTSAVLHRSLQHRFLRLSSGKKSRLTFENGRTVIDASGGAAVACIGHGDDRVKKAIAAQLDKISYCSTIFYTTNVCEELCQELVNSTHGYMTRALIVSSGK
jgi:adenosylmethionine-8-amino-7-oxononanoate aminotransferase